MQTAYLGLGSNLGDRRARLLEALHRLEGSDLIIAQVSSLYESAPLGPILDQPSFYNAVVELKTTLSPRALLGRAQGVEQQMKRERLVAQGPRTIDLDLLLFERRVETWPELTLPHPRYHLRAFVLQPLLELAPGLIDPRTATPLRASLAKTTGQLLSRLGPLRSRPSASTDALAS